MSEYLITGDPDQHNRPAPILIDNDGENFVFVHPSLVEQRQHTAVRFPTVQDARAMADRIPCRMEIAAADFTNRPDGTLQVDIQPGAEKHPGKPRVVGQPAVTGN